MTRELTIPVDYALAREALTASCPAPRRSQIDDTLFRRYDPDPPLGMDRAVRFTLARLRRQDAVTRLSCTRPDLELSAPPETVVLNGEASRHLLGLLGFEAIDRVRLTRETWRSSQYFLHLDRVEGLGDFITLQAERGAYTPALFKKIALKVLKSLGVHPAWERDSPAKLKARSEVDSPEALTYTASITRAASAPS